MPEIPLTLVTPGRLNKPAWYRTRTAELGPVRKSDSPAGPLTSYNVYLDGELIGSVSGTLKAPTGTLRLWAPDQELAAGVTPRGNSRFEAVDALVRTRLVETRQHPISRAAAA